MGAYLSVLLGGIRGVVRFDELLVILEPASHWVEILCWLNHSIARD